MLKLHKEVRFEVSPHSIIFNLVSMKRIGIILCLLTLATMPQQVSAQINEDKTGAWYMYFFTGQFSDSSSWGFQGDIQHRNWNLGGDLEQLLIRGGFTFKPRQSQIKFTLGYGHITSGTYGESTAKKMESRIYQEALYPVKFGKRIHTNHRFRFEQRFVDNQDLRTRYRYNLFINIPLNNKSMSRHTAYIALYNELFINGQRQIGNGNVVELFDRNRAYAALGFVVTKGLKVQLGFMNQTTDNWSKNQLQCSVHHQF